MAAFFFDTSALVKRFVRETGSAWVIGLLKPSNKNTVYIARVTSVEVIAAITRRSSIGTLTTADAGKSITRFERSLTSRYAFVEISNAVISRAMSLTKKYSLRGYDAMQLSAALETNDMRVSLGAPALTFISADNNLNTAASSEGLLIDNPNNHP